MNLNLLTRDQFRESVFNRDNHKCVFCSNVAADAHHIMERRLFNDGGYYVDNGISVCEPCHKKCESTEYSVEDALNAGKIKKRVTPLHLYSGEIYDKWGNQILENGSRMPGELFYDDSVQSALKSGPNYHLYLKYVKYPRTYHLPWSEGINKDDRVLTSLNHFEGREVVVTYKMDGENTNLYRDYYHARSVDSKNHPSRTWIKTFWARMSYNIPDGYRVCGENMFATHSIRYEHLQNFFYGFSMWDEKNTCMSWDDTLEWFSLLDIISVPVIYRGVFNEKAMRSIKLDLNRHEGYVVRLADAFSYSEFKNSVAKFVRNGHVQTKEHWMMNRVEVNVIATSPPFYPER